MKIDKQYIQKIVEAIESLAENPFPPQSKKLKHSESSYRLRVGDYRVIYQVDHVRTWTISKHGLP
ncbi:MAG: type II toxin-antitoxin system RelE/ParE family toxin [Desulfobacterium sp.]|nr:type II toxin-antitoxin system RelE/ParE family toxin [Desulfobacterium sp.]MBU3948621.1 type II toxin-antitoxin system RelE/ParE family toxin [Pseudomonadota bacterium]MBU4009311.1 type II toxin-antitoxin system RelE/ParE family toxin [Pseudomonadota bacterium]MBU4036046.1 type II toxin-antitoxin system RelE/ParE family toxin [Pseudomonadota bacterium]